jgi:hypothetical protein
MEFLFVIIFICVFAIIFIRVFVIIKWNFYSLAIINMEQNNLYYNVNENPNIFPPAKSYIQQTQIRHKPGVINKQFQNLAFEQQQNNNKRFFASSQQNLANTNGAQFASRNPGSRESRQSNTVKTTTGTGVVYANMPSASGVYANMPSASGVYANMPSAANDVEPVSSEYEYDDRDRNGGVYDHHHPNDDVMRHQEHQLQLDAQRVQYNMPYDSQGDVILQSNDINNQLTDHMAYPNVYAPKPFFQLPQNNLIADPDPCYLSVDSHDRDRKKYPNPNDYTISFVSPDSEFTTGSRYKNILEIQLVEAILPNRANILDEIYLILEIDEIDNPVFDASNPNLAKAFSKMRLCPSGSTKWVYLDVDYTWPTLKRFYPKPKSSLDRLSIKILKRDGTPFSFGTDNALPADVNKDLQNTFTFKITQSITDVDVVGQRNI